MSNRKLYVHIWLKKSGVGTYSIYRSYVSLTGDLPNVWNGKTFSEEDKFDVQQIEWPEGVEEVVL